jgi:hypothetical protein
LVLMARCTPLLAHIYLRHTPHDTKAKIERLK